MRTLDEAAVRRCVPTSVGDLASEVARICEPAEISEDEVFGRCGVDDLAIPGRVYAAEPDLNGLAPLTQLVAATLLTRHSDGYVRQRSLEAVLEANAELVDAAWTAAYVVELLGEYVIEIHETIADRLLPKLVVGCAQREVYANYVRENPGRYAIVSARAVSYWSCYYRQRFPRTFPRSQGPLNAGYPAFAVLEALRGLAHPSVPHHPGDKGST